MLCDGVDDCTNRGDETLAICQDLINVDSAGKTFSEYNI